MMVVFQLVFYKNQLQICFNIILLNKNNEEILGENSQVKSFNFSL